LGIGLFQFERYVSDVLDGSLKKKLYQRAKAFGTTGFVTISILLLKSWLDVAKKKNAAEYVKHQK
jgi:hypothetical protein